MTDIDMPDAGPAAPTKDASNTKVAKTGTAENATDARKRFEVKKVREPPLKHHALKTVLTFSQWNAVALWAWDIVVDNCAICRNHIMDLCQFPHILLCGPSLIYIRYRVSSKSGFRYKRRVHCGMGNLQCKSIISSKETQS